LIDFDFNLLLSFLLCDRQAAEVDGKAHNSLVKLQLFRQFYIVVVLFIYFTRIAVFLIESTMPFYLEWLGPFSSELAALAFYIYTGYQFQPTVNNPYLVVSSEDYEGKEYGLDDDVFDASMEIELGAPSMTRKH
jgi:G protein-coupled receptor 107